MDALPQPTLLYNGMVSPPFLEKIPFLYGSVSVIAVYLLVPKSFIQFRRRDIGILPETWLEYVLQRHIHSPSLLCLDLTALLVGHFLIQLPFSPQRTTTNTSLSPTRVLLLP